MSPLDPLENGAEIEELLKFHCQLFAKVSGIFLRSCLLRLRASERASKPETEGGRKGGVGGAQTARHRARVRSGAGQGLRRQRGLEARGAGHQQQGPRAGSREPGAGEEAQRARSRAGFSRSSESSVAELERRGRLELCAPMEASGAASGEAPGAALEKAGSGGVATRSHSSPRPLLALLLPNSGRERGREEGKRGSCREGGLCRRSTPLPWPAAEKGREGSCAPRIAHPEPNSWGSGRKKREWKTAKPRAQGSAALTQRPTNSPTGALAVPFEKPGGRKVAEQRP